MRNRKILFILALFIILPCIGRAAKEEEDRTKSSFEISYHEFYFEDEIFEDVFDRDSLAGTGLSIGYYPLRNLEMGFRVVSVYREGDAIGELTEERSGEEFELQIYPLSLNLTYRLDFFNEQVLVPWASFGGDYCLYEEDKEFGEDVEGGVGGSHWGAGLALLLDRIDPGGASSLLRDFRVNNTFLNFGYESARIERDDDAGLYFSNDNFSLGLLFEFR